MVAKLFTVIVQNHNDPSWYLMPSLRDDQSFANEVNGSYYQKIRQDTYQVFNPILRI